MEYRQLGRSGLRVSAVGLGANNFGKRCDLAATRAVVDAALDVGVTLIDTADSYGNLGGSEELLGEVLQGKRSQVVLATKFGNDMGTGEDARGSRRYIRRAVEASLRRLRTDWIDLYQYHMPDGLTPIEETLAALDELVVDGKVRYIGSSNLAAWQVVDAAWQARAHRGAPFVSAQNHYSLLERVAEADLIPACEAHGVGVLPYFPLADGLLTGKYRRGHDAPTGTRLAERPGALNDATFDQVEELERFASDCGRTLLEVAVGGLLSRSVVSSVIAGATRPEQVRANAAAAERPFSPDERSALDRLLATFPGSLK